MRARYGAEGGGVQPLPTQAQPDGLRRCAPATADSLCMGSIERIGDVLASSRKCYSGMNDSTHKRAMQPFDKEKFKSLVLYVIWRTGDLRDFGSVKLNKALWFSDARTFEALGKAVTGETYVREKFGPVPHHILPVLDELQAEGLIQPWREPFFEFEITRYRAHQPPDTSMFTAEQLGIIDWWIRHIAEEHTAASISEASHDYAWKIAKFGEALPYQAFLARRIRQPSGDELEWAKAAADRLESK